VQVDFHKERFRNICVSVRVPRETFAETTLLHVECPTNPFRDNSFEDTFRERCHCQPFRVEPTFAQVDLHKERFRNICVFVRVLREPFAETTLLRVEYPHTNPFWDNSFEDIFRERCHCKPFRAKPTFVQVGFDKERFRNICIRESSERNLCSRSDITVRGVSHPNPFQDNSFFERGATANLFGQSQHLCRLISAKRGCPAPAAAPRPPPARAGGRAGGGGRGAGGGGGKLKVIARVLRRPPWPGQPVCGVP